MKILSFPGGRFQNVRIRRKHKAELPMCIAGQCDKRGVVSPRWNREAHVMIRLTRLNNRPLVVNSELIKFIENAPDTVITLVSGEKIVVLETPEEVINRIVDYRRRLRQSLRDLPGVHNSAEGPDVPDLPPGMGELSRDKDGD